MTAPRLVDLDALGILLQRTVPPEFEDLNGHVNVRHHYGLHVDGMERAFVDHFDLGHEHVEKTRQSSFSLDHHVRFHREILVDHEVSVHQRVLGRSAKIIHILSILANRSTGEVASTLEYVEAYVDLATRRTTAMPDQLAAVIDDWVARQVDLPWDLPLSGTLGTSRPSRPATA